VANTPERATPNSDGSSSGTTNVPETFFVRPALWAAMEVGVAVLLDAVNAFRSPWTPAEARDAELEELGRSLRRSLYAAMLDRQITADNLRTEQLALIEGSVRRGQSSEVAKIPEPVAV
jgi:hypothetical protein